MPIKKKKTGYCKRCYLEKYLPSVRIVDRNDSSSWKRQCPKCKTDIIFTSWAAYYSSIKYNRVCLVCGFGKKERKKCSSCNKELLLKNTSGYCAECYNTIINIPSKAEGKSRRTYHCPKCNEYIYSNDYAVTKKNILRGYCYKCLNKETLFIPIKRNCIVCCKEFIIIDSSKQGIKTCGDGCKYKWNVKSTAQYISDAIKIHGTRYDYSLVDYKNSSTKIKVICKTHGSFDINPNMHLNERGCSKCKISKGESKILDWLVRRNIIHTHQHKFNDCRNPLTNCQLKFDFYITPKNILIEFDGEQHTRIGAKVRNHILTADEVEKIKYRDGIKTQYALTKGIKLIRIPYTAINNIEDILQKEICG